MGRSHVASCIFAFGCCKNEEVAALVKISEVSYIETHVRNLLSSRHRWLFRLHQPAKLLNTNFEVRRIARLDIGVRQKFEASSSDSVVSGPHGYEPLV